MLIFYFFRILHRHTHKIRFAVVIDLKVSNVTNHISILVTRPDEQPISVSNFRMGTNDYYQVGNFMLLRAHLVHSTAFCLFRFVQSNTDSSTARNPQKRTNKIAKYVSWFQFVWQFRPSPISISVAADHSSIH